MKKIIFLFILFAWMGCEPERDSALRTADINLIPDDPGITPSYYCTWGAQNYAIDSLSVVNSITLGGHTMTANNLTQDHFFGMGDGLLYRFDKVRKDLFVLFDLGWDVPPDTPFDTARWLLGSMVASNQKFPLASGKPAERMKKLNALVQAAGWKGAGVWVAAHAYGDREMDFSEDLLKQYFRERIKWSRDAGVNYWKVDYGFYGQDPAFRKMLTEIARQYHPDLWIEHSLGSGPLNDEPCPWDTDNFHHQGSFKAWDNGAKIDQAVRLIRFSDVFRTYDVTAQLSVPTTLDRVAQILAAVDEAPDSKALLNCEDEPYLGAALGCAIGIMRHPDMIDVEGWDYDPYEVSNRIDEVTRAVRWQRIAPAFGAGTGKVYLDSTRLSDTWTFRSGESWATWVTGKEVMQGAPARVSRRMPLAEVSSGDPVPYVVTSRHPNGAVAVATLPRVSSEKGFYHPGADIGVSIDSPEAFVGIFGTYASLTLRFPGPVQGYRVLAQDLAGDVAFDITELVSVNERNLVLPGSLIEKVGLISASEGDISEPGLVLKLQKE